MRFGEQFFFERLRAAVEQGDASIYDDLNACIDASIARYVHARVQADDANDVLQEVKLKVWQSLWQYLKDSVEKSPQQREKWLERIAERKIIDFYRKQTIKANYNEHEGGPSRVIRETPYGDDLDVFSSTRKSPEEEVMARTEEAERRRRLEDLIRRLCDFNVPPQRLLAFFYNTIIMPLSFGNQKKGSPKALIVRFGSVPLHQMRLSVETDMNAVLGFVLSQDVFRQLDIKLELCKDQLFEMDEREITYTTSAMRSRLRAQEKQLAGGKRHD